MKLRIGVWIDHRRALIVYMEDRRVGTKAVTSHLEKRVRASGGYRGSVPYAAQDVVDEDRIERKYAHHLEGYFKRVADVLGEPDALFIFGPAQAKQEFNEYLTRAHHQLTEIPIEIETTDKLTDPQIVAAVKKHFADR